MKKKIVIISIIIIICLLTLYTISVCDYEGVHSGMSSNDYYELIPAENRFNYHYYSFYTNKWGNPVVVRFNTDSNPLIAEIRCYSSLWISQSPMAFSRIKKSMSLFEVTSIVGPPVGTRTSGLWSLDYLDTRGQTYTVMWNGSVSDSEVFFVHEVYVEPGA